MYIPPVISLQIEMSLAVFSSDCGPLYLHVLHVQLAVHDHELHQNLQTPDLFTYRKPSEFTCPTLSSFISLLSCSHRRLKGKWWLVYLVSPLRGERRLSPVTDLEVAQQTPARRMEAGVGELSLVPPVPRDQHHLARQVVYCVYWHPNCQFTFLNIASNSVVSVTSRAFCSKLIILKLGTAHMKRRAWWCISVSTWGKFYKIKKIPTQRRSVMVSSIYTSSI